MVNFRSKSLLQQSYLCEVDRKAAEVGASGNLAQGAEGDPVVGVEVVHLDRSRVGLWC